MNDLSPPEASAALTPTVSPPPAEPPAVTAELLPKLPLRQNHP